MLQAYICSRGHRWEASAPPGEIPDPPTCPICGTEATIESGRASTEIPLDKLPPAPRPLGDSDVVLAETMQPSKEPFGPQRRISEIPGYEILGELGRGGMGVVLKAHQIALDRIVAIKTISAAAQFDPESRSRFRSEAEAVAQLNHPYIAQIHEVDEYNDAPYLVMEFVDGGSLAEQTKEHSPSPTEAARLVERVARAVAFAHQRGVIHRDLKPANVLLTPDGTPKITDFGLAKRLDRDSAQTRTGSVMGTPNYMAPEQAEGRTQTIGPLSDVYGLGAVLYDVLSGRPPFRGDTPVDTVRQVVETEPVRPRLLNPKVPRDLETICLKCLEKNPSQRYVTADSLADDLQRYLAGEPIEARPISATGRAWRWCRRKPWIASLSAASVVLFLIALAASTLGYLSTSAALSNSRAAEAKAKKSEESAKRSYLDALDAVNEFYGLVGGEMLLQTQRDTIPLREQLLRRGVDYYERLLKDPDSYLLRNAAAEPHDDLKLREKVGDSWNTYGRVLFRLDQLDAAADAFEKAAAFREKLARKHPDRQSYQRKLANSHMNAGIVEFAQGNPAETRARFELAQSIREQLVDDENDAKVSGELAMGFYNLGKLSFALGETESARERLLRARDRFQKLHESDSGNAYIRYRLSLCHETLGDLEESISGALSRYVAAQGHLKLLVRDNSGRVEYQVELARVCIKSGELYFQQRRFEQSLQLLRQAEAILQELLDKVPDSQQFADMLAGTRRSIELVQQQSSEGKSDSASR